MLFFDIPFGKLAFVGDDWKGHPKWQKYEMQFKDVDAKIIYFPYTKDTSSTKIRSLL